MARNKVFLYAILILLLAGDGIWSFVQHGQKPLDGDMPRGIVPADDVRPLLEDPLGLRVWREGRRYQNPNRFFSYSLFYHYWRTVPRWLQRWASPVDSVYLAAALAKTVLQLLLILLLAFLIRGVFPVHRGNLIYGAALATPFFQTNGYRSYMGIIDPAITYTFHYALPAVGLLLGALAMQTILLHRPRWRNPTGYFLLWLPLGVLTCLSGPLNPPAVLLGAALIACFALFQSMRPDPLATNQAAPPAGQGKLWRMIAPWALMAAYSLVLGTYSTENQDFGPGITERYLLLLTGLGKMFTGKLGLPLLLASLIGCHITIRRMGRDSSAARWLSLFRWLALFALLYLALLPWGGYRVWRPYIVRYDTFLPVTLAMIVLYGSGMVYLINTLKGHLQRILIGLAVGIALVFTLADGMEWGGNTCERQALNRLATASEPVVRLTADCTVLSWEPIRDPSASGLSARLLYIWGISGKDRLYYQAE
jgi:hypothetical protein